MSKYSDIDLDKISYLIEVKGYNDSQLIEYLGISRPTFYKWKKEKVNFSNTLKKSRVKLVSKIKDSLVKKTEGFYVTEWKEIVVEGEVVKVENSKYIPPSDTAIIFALANLDPENWKRQDKQVIDTNKDKAVIPNIQSDDDILKMIELDDE